MFVFPVHLFNPQAVEAEPVRSVITGGASVSNVEDAIATDGGGLWRISYTGIKLDAQLRRILNAWSAHLAGGAVDCLVPLVSMVTANMPVVQDGPLEPSDLDYDDEIFPTYVRLSHPHIVATCGAAAMRATTLTIDVAKGAALLGGERFSIGERSYNIERKTGTSTFKIDPPLREAVIAGTAVEFEWPVVKCRLVPGQSIIPPAEFDGSGEASLTFMESR